MLSCYTGSSYRHRQLYHNHAHPCDLLLLSSAIGWLYGSGLATTHKTYCADTLKYRNVIFYGTYMFKL